MNFGNINIGDLLKTQQIQTGSTETVKQSQGGLSSLSESSSQAQTVKKNKEFNQSSPDLPPPSVGVRVEFSFLTISDEDLKNFLFGSIDAKQFQKETESDPDLNLTLLLRRAADEERIEDDGTADVFKILKKLLSKILEQIVSGNPNISDVCKEIASKLKIEVFKEDFPQAEVCLSLLKEEGATTNKEMDEALFSQLQTLFSENGKAFSLESIFMPEALHQLAVSKLIAQGLSAEDAEEKANSLLGSATVQKQVTTWMDKMSQAEPNETPPPAPSSQETNTILSEITSLIEGSELPQGEKVSLLAFLKLVSSAIKEIKDLLAEIIRSDAGKQKQIGLSNLGLAKAFGDAARQASMKQEEIRKMFEEAQSRQTDSKETIKGQLQEEHTLSPESEKMSDEEFTNIVKNGPLEAFQNLFSPPLGDTQAAADLVNRLYTPIGQTMVNFLSIFLQSQLSGDNSIKFDLAKRCLELTGMSEVFDILFKQLTGLNSTRLLGGVSVDLLTQAIEEMANKQKANNPNGANQLLSQLSDLLSSIVGKNGTTEEKAAALSLASLFLNALTLGMKGPGELNNEASIPLMTAYLNDIGLSSLALLKFAKTHRLSDGSGGEDVGRLAGEALLVGFTLLLLSRGGDAGDVSACLDFLNTVARGIDRAGFSQTLSEALKEALGLDGSDAASLQEIFSGLLGQLGGKEASEGADEEVATLIKLLRTTLKQLEALLQKLLGGAASGDIPSEEMTEEANAVFQTMIQQFFEMLSHNQAESLQESSARSIEMQEKLGCSPESAQFLISSMLQAGLGPSNAGLGQKAAA